MGNISDRIPIEEADYNILKQVSLDKNYLLKDLLVIYALESNSGNQEGTNRSTFKGPFQFDDDTASDFKLNNVWDLKESAEAHIRLVDKRTKSVETYLKNRNLPSNLLDSLDTSTFNYLLHNQGAWGTARLEIGADKGAYIGYYDEKGVYHKGAARKNMLANLTDEQQKHFKDPKVSIEEATKYFIKSIDSNLVDTRNMVNLQSARLELPPPVRAVMDSAAIDTFLTRETP